MPALHTAHCTYFYWKKNSKCGIVDNCYCTHQLSTSPILHQRRESNEHTCSDLHPHRDCVSNTAVPPEVADQLGVSAGRQGIVSAAHAVPLVRVVAVAAGAETPSAVSDTVSEPVLWVLAVVASSTHGHKVNQRRRRQQSAGDQQQKTEQHGWLRVQS